MGTYRVKINGKMVRVQAASGFQLALAVKQLKEAINAKRRKSSAR